MLAASLRALDEAIDQEDRGRKMRRLLHLELLAERRLGRAFRRQGRLFVARLRNALPAPARRPSRLREADLPIGWLALFLIAALATRSEFLAAIGEAQLEALLLGQEDASAELGMEIRFGLRDPRAIAYLATHGAEQVDGIEETTREELRRILTEGREAGWSTDKIAKAISAKFAEFATPDPRLHIRSRAHLIAVTETGQAYEEGHMGAARELAAHFAMEKSWLTAHDERVDDVICGPNEDQGWIPIDEPFQSGHDHPLGHPGCRCSGLTRRAPGSEITPIT